MRSLSHANTPPIGQGRTRVTPARMVNRLPYANESACRHGVSANGPTRYYLNLTT